VFVFSDLETQVLKRNSLRVFIDLFSVILIHRILGLFLLLCENIVMSRATVCHPVSCIVAV